MASNGRARLLHVISGLGVGGANLMLWKLLAARDRGRYDVAVISLADRGGGVDRAIEELGVPVYTVGMDPRPTPGAVLRMILWARRFRPDVIQGWMYHGNVAASICAPFVPDSPPVLWNVRHSLSELAHERRNTRAMIRLGTVLSSRVVRLLYNSEVSARQHEALGFDPARRQIVPNGFDTERYRPSETARVEVRRELGVPEDTPLVGLVARFHPMKDHLGFLRAARLVRDTGAHFVGVGLGVDDANRALTEPIAELGLSGRVHLLGVRRDVERITAALDVATCCSLWGEGFPNVVGEAMACGVPCVVTDVGDSARIAGAGGRVVPPGDPERLAAAWRALLELPVEERRAIGGAGREICVREYGIDAVVATYEGLYDAALGASARLRRAAAAG